MNSRSLSQLTRALAVVIAATLVLAGIAFASGPQEKILYSFQGSSAASGQDGEGPNDLISDAAGNLYGVTTGGGICVLTHYQSYPCGTVFELSPPITVGGEWTETVLYEFGTNAGDGTNPVGNLIRDKKGNLYGVTAYSGQNGVSGYGCGNFYELSPPSQPGGVWTETVLYNFQGNSDGCSPLGTLVVDSHGNIYGATGGGGSLASLPPPKGNDTGGIFQMAPPTSKGGSWTESFTQSLGGGIYPGGPLTIDQQGNLYGATRPYGTTYQATIFQLIPPASPGGTWTGTALYSFPGGSDGSAVVGLNHDIKVTLYGVTQDGGTAGLGTVFKLVPTQNGSWTKIILYSFQGGNDGATPLGRMTLDYKGNLYGTTFGGGGNATACPYGNGCGTVFKLTHGTSGWSEQVTHRFQGSPADGFYPSARVLVVGEKIFGTTNEGGNVSPYFFGTVFEIE